MLATVTTVRRGLFGMFAGGLFAFGAAAIVSPVASAQPADPACSASNIAGTVSNVAASEGAYLAANPQINDALTDISAQPQPEAQSAYAAFFQQNPQIEDQLMAVHQPASALEAQCGLKVEPTPVAQAVWSAGSAETPTSRQAPEVIAPPMAPGMTPDSSGMPMA
ncbi:heme-binding protein [Mycobacterium sp. 236(2023)]|uniref:heme-binding protein n=1 Tax=Mycobacterium sp. 236(2023) TaxID=3038163 RepID=UPI002415781C|nr:heme-binding protein [Mycobacterium sp. 236(2023)]MDG4665410.1 heme-binding protein [Mycobacterium sp. 236(2023)]